MILLTSTSDKLQLVTINGGADIDVHTSFVDNNAGTITPDRLNVSGIITATSSDIVPSPASGVQRNVKNVTVNNVSGSVAELVTIRHTDGTNIADLFSVTLLPNEKLVCTEKGEWLHYDTQGAEYSYNVPPIANLGISGTIAETHPRELINEANNSVGASGTLFFQAIYLTAGQLVSEITISSATTAASGASNLFFALYDVNRNLVAQSADQGAYVWNSNSTKTLAMTTPYRVPNSGLYYVGLLQVATTIATIKGNATRVNGILAAAIPPICGNTSTGLTTTLPNPAANISSSSTSMYAAVS